MESPKFKLVSIMNDGLEEDPKFFPVENLPYETNTNRRGFLGAGMTAIALLASSKIFGRNAHSAPNITMLKAHDSSIRSLYFTKNGKTLISLADDDLKLWALPEKKLLGKIKDKTIKNAALSPDDKIFAVAAENKIEIRSLKNAALIKTIATKTDNLEIDTICFTPDNKFLLALDDRSNQLISWDCNTWKKGTFLPAVMNGDIKNIFFTPAGNLMISIELNFDPKKDTSITSINVRSAADGKLIKKLFEFVSPNGEFLCIASADGKRLFFKNTSYETEPLEIWDLEKMKKEYSYPINERYEKKIFAVSPDGLKVFICPKTAVQICEAPRLSNAQKKILEMMNVRDYEQLKKPVVDLCDHNGSIQAIAASIEGSWLASGDYSGVIRISDWRKQECLGFVFDPRVNEDDGISYNIYDKQTGQTLSYTLPCGSSIPPGAVCTCNCVSGTKPVYVPPSYNDGGGSYCSCNKVCVCIPVCQAHKLLHPDKFVRMLSKEILLFMGKKEMDYMKWAAGNSKKKLKPVIISLVKKIKKGMQPKFENWPSIDRCTAYLSHNDKVISIMAAQMINLQIHLNGHFIPHELYLKVDALLRKSRQLHWQNKLM